MMGLADHGTSEANSERMVFFPDDDGDCYSDDTSDPDCEGCGQGDFWSAVNAGIFGDVENIERLSRVFDQTGDEIALDSDQELALAQVAHLSNSRKRNRRNRKEINRITEEDYEEGPERDAFIIMRDRVRASFLKDVPLDERMSCIEWIFCGTENPISFDLCAEALGARPNAIRKRLMYEYYRRWIVFPAPLPFLAVPLPEDIGSYVNYKCGDSGLAVAVAIWYWPGIETGEILEMCNMRGSSVSMADIYRVDETGIIANNMDNWYVTSRRQRVDSDEPAARMVQSIYG